MSQVRKKRINTDAHFVVTLKDNGVSIAWDSTTIKQICMYSEEQRAFAGRCSYQVDAEDNTKLRVLYPASEQLYLGNHRIVARLIIAGDEATVDAFAISFVATTDTSETVEPSDQEDEIDIAVEEVDTTIMHEILAACMQATDDARETEADLEEAEAARVLAEAARVEAEAARVLAEASRVEAEAARVEAETAREEAEGERSEAEAERSEAEAAREQSETERGDAEAERAEHELARNAAELARAAAELAREEAEIARNTAELARAAAEASRSQAEAERASSEADRESAEAAREEAEGERSEAEAQRVEEFNEVKEEASDAAADAREAVATMEGTYAKIEGQELKATAEHLARLFHEIAGLKALVDNLGDARARSLTVDEMIKICGEDLIVEATAAPSAAPEFIGQIYADRTNGVSYIALGTGATSDWKRLGLKSEIDGKVDKINGKGLSTNDLTNQLLALINGSLQRSNIINDLTHTDTDKALAANQGKALKALIDAASLVISQNAETVGEHLTKIMYEIRSIVSMLHDLGDLRVRSITSDNMIKLCGEDMILQGSGAPTMVPDFIGQEYLDLTNNKAYKAFGTTNVSHWKALN